VQFYRWRTAMLNSSGDAGDVGDDRQQLYYAGDTAG